MAQGDVKLTQVTVRGEKRQKGLLQWRNSDALHVKNVTSVLLWCTERWRGWGVLILAVL